MSIIIDMMEYASDALAQAAYITNAGYDSYTVCLLHCEGANGAVSFIDSATAKAFTAVGAIQLSTAQYKFGAASITTDGNADYIYNTNASADFTFGTAAFTVEMWVRITTIARTNIFFSLGGSNTMGGVIGANSSGNLLLYALGYRIQDAGAMLANTWYHIALVGNGGAAGSRTLKLYRDGIQIGSTWTYDYNYTMTGIQFGTNQSATTECLLGFMDEIRVSKGIQRWTANFTAPTAAYNPFLQSLSENTIKTQGSYALKITADITNSLNKTLTKTISLDISDKNRIRLDLRASRIGSNIKIGFHDTGGTTTEYTPNILVADTFQRVFINLVNTPRIALDSIDQIIITIINADADNTIYIDNIYTDNWDTYLRHRGRSRIDLAPYSGGT